MFNAGSDNVGVVLFGSSSSTHLQSMYIPLWSGIHMALLPISVFSNVSRSLIGDVKQLDPKQRQQNFDSYP